MSLCHIGLVKDHGGHLVQCFLTGWMVYRRLNENFAKGEWKFCKDEWKFCKGEWKFCKGEWKFRKGWMKILQGWMKILQGWMKILQGWTKILQGWMKILQGWMKILQGWMKISQGWMKILFLILYPLITCIYLFFYAKHISNREFNGELQAFWLCVFSSQKPITSE